MSYLKEVKWVVEPISSPKIKKSCPKCGQGSLFVNSEKFRVNANKNKLDVWLIYQCEKCKSTWNMTLYERINPKEIPSDLYHKFMTNHGETARAYGFDKGLHLRNRVVCDYDGVDYSVKGNRTICKEAIRDGQGGIELSIVCDKVFNLRLDKLLSKELELTRSQIKKLHDAKTIWSATCKRPLREKINGTFTLNIGNDINNKEA
jgi:hypothetical protein